MKRNEPSILLTGKNINLNVITNLQELFVRDSFLITLNNQPDSIIKVFKIPSFKIFNSFGRKGKGPDEFIFPHLIFNSGENNTFGIYDPGTKSYSMTDIIENRNAAKRKISIPDIPFSIFMKDNKYFVYDSFTPTTGAIKTYELETNKVITICDFEEFARKHKASAAYEGILGINPKTNLIAYLFTYYDRIEIRNELGKLNKVIIDKNNPEPEHEINSNSMVYYIGGYFTENYIYGLYIKQSKVKMLEKSDNVISFVDVFSWEGVQQKRLKLDRLVYNISIDEDKGVIYAKDPKNINELCQFDIP